MKNGWKSSCIRHLPKDSILIYELLKGKIPLNVAKFQNGEVANLKYESQYHNALFNL